MILYKVKYVQYFILMYKFVYLTDIYIHKNIKDTPTPSI